MSKNIETLDIEALARDLESLAKDPSKAIDVFKTLNEKVISLTHKNKALETEVEATRHEVSKKEKEIACLANKTDVLEFQISKQEKDAAEKTAKIIFLDEQVGFLNEENERLRLLIKKRAMQLFASKSEKLCDQLPLFNEPSFVKEVEDEDVGSEEEISITRKVSKKKGVAKVRAIDPSLERQDIVIDVKDEEKTCPCGCTKQVIGEEVSEKLEMIPAKLVVNRYRRLKYACRSCEEGVITAPVKKSIIPGSMAEPSLLAHIITAKYADHIPLYRQETVLDRIGINLTRGTLSHWVLKAGEALKPLYDHLCKKVVGSGYVQADETTLQVLKEKNRRAQTKSYMWMYKAGIEPYVVYEYQPTRGGEHPRNFLKGFEGILQTDDWSAYKGCSKIWAKCWAHARRKFHEVYELSGKKKGVAYDLLKLISKLYKIERECQEKGLSYEKTRDIRNKEAKPILEDIKKILEEKIPQTARQSDIGNALRYSLRNWEGLTEYLKDGRIHIDNNASERCIKPFVIGRRNWLFNDNVRGANVSSILFSIMETAKAHEVNVQKYLQFILEKQPTSDNVQDLLPSAYISASSENKTP